MEPLKLDAVSEEPPAATIPTPPAPPPVRNRYDVDALAAGVLAGNRAMLGRAITLIESRNPVHQRLGAELSLKLFPHSGKAFRVGITGVPGVGKSTFIEAFGCNLIREGLKVAVLAVDPTSPVSGGSILADKTRMERLGVAPNAFIRPSPSGGTLGGVARTTRQTIVVCEAAGFDVILVETVGTGQSEVAVSDMTDVFLVLMLPGAGDELQGIKKGVLEIADMIAVNKSDGDNATRARAAASEYRAALNIMAAKSASWTPPVVLVSGLANQGLEAMWEQVTTHRAKLEATGEFAERRRVQQVAWMWSMLEDRLMQALRHDPRIADRLIELEGGVREGRVSASVAVDEVAHTLGI